MNIPRCNKPIGVFDSGIGGLTVVKEIFNFLPNESIIYFGDTARVPYGTKSKETVKKFSLQILKFLESKKVKLIVVACNTASSYALKELKNSTSIPVVGVIKPAVLEAIRITSTGRIGVIGTEGTIKSKSYEVSIKKFNRKIKVFSTPCPLFVSLVEEGWIDNSKYENITTEIANIYLKKLKNKIDTLILGCTHYPLIKKIISSVCTENIRIIDSATATAKYVKSKLIEMNLLSTGNTPVHEFFVSDAPEKFILLSNTFLGKKISNIKKVNIEEF